MDHQKIMYLFIMQRKKDDVQVLKLDGVKKTRTGYNTITPPTTLAKILLF